MPSTRRVSLGFVLCAATSAALGCADPAADAAGSVAAQASTPDGAATPAPTSSTSAAPRTAPTTSATDPAKPAAQAADASPKMCGDIVVPPRAYAKQAPHKLGPAAHGLPDYWPTKDWQTKPAAELGFDAQKLEQAMAFSTRAHNTQAMLVIRHGYVAFEKYVAPFAAGTRHESYSMAKSFTSSLVGIAIDEGKLASTDEKICKYYPSRWNCADSSDPRSRITVEHAMNLSTGLEWKEDWRSFATGPNDAMALGDMLDKALGRKSVAEPGTTMRYSTGDPALLTAVIQQSVGKTAYAYAKEKLFDVIGIAGVRWNQHPSGQTTVFAGLSATAREFAKFGYLYLRHGEWEGKQVVPGAWVDRTTKAEKPCSDWYRYLWHQNFALRLGEQDRKCPVAFCQPTNFADVPADAFMAKGVFGQYVIIMPSEDLIIVRLAQDQMGSEHWDDWSQGVVPGVLGAIVK
ncbi:MAG: serine hydrolase [Polyangiales bacterium]